MNKKLKKALYMFGFALPIVAIPIITVACKTETVNSLKDKKIQKKIETKKQEKSQETQKDKKQVETNKLQKVEESQKTTKTTLTKINKKENSDKKSFVNKKPENPLKDNKIKSDWVDLKDKHEPNDKNIKSEWIGSNVDDLKWLEDEKEWAKLDDDIVHELWIDKKEIEKEVTEDGIEISWEISEVEEPILEQKDNKIVYDKIIDFWIEQKDN